MCDLWCGEARAIEKRGYEVISTDIINGDDYLVIDTPQNVDWIITNPPFSLASEFIVKSLQRGLPFAFLLKAHFWNAKSRYALFYGHPPTYILPLTWRPDFMFKTRGSGSPLLDVMWCVWIPGETKTLFRPLAKPLKEE